LRYRARNKYKQAIESIAVFDLSLAIQLFVLLNPLASFPFLIQAYQKKVNVQMIAVKATLTAFSIAVVMAITGPILFDVFGITLDSFRVAGGLVLLILAYNMVKPGEEKEHREIKNIDALTTIIATPMLTGPAVISFITVKAYEIGRTDILTHVVAAFVLVGAVFFVFSLLVSKINPKLVNILSRILGLFLMAVAIEMISKGIEGLVRAII
jgi:multiple antibiotic resistance protein